MIGVEVIALDLAIAVNWMARAQGPDAARMLVTAADLAVGSRILDVGTGPGHLPRVLDQFLSPRQLSDTMNLVCEVT